LKLDNQIIEQFKKQFEVQLLEVDKKIENVNSYAEKIFGGLTEEILKTSKKISNKSESMELNQIH